MFDDISGTDVALRIRKIVTGSVSLILAIKDANLIRKTQLWFWNRQKANDWELNNNGTGSALVCIGGFTCLSAVALII